MSAARKPTVRKVCGITRPADAKQAVRSGANAIGMIFYPPSPRSITASQAELVSSAVPDGVRKVGVFVAERHEVIASTILQVGLNVVQIHGEDYDADRDAIRRAVGDGIEIWKAIRVGADFDAGDLAAFEADAFLLDTARRGLYGGTGETFAWDLALRARPFGRIVVAGGLDGANVAQAIRVARPWGVDSSSRLEVRPGIKDPDMVTRFLEAAR